ncbi:hypothetical protein Q0812_08995 [Brevundimonas sp. 2R-24]|uniref:Uncharacterized protein n=1 Tax=Peiella sedimenti TaxID=3061083 RepID=A0ABT8SMH9_9CAUL|nr:hypothetical protein [Caulobacteraceae bacterium XZ-24]
MNDEVVIEDETPEGELVHWGEPRTWHVKPWTGVLSLVGALSIGIVLGLGVAALVDEVWDD